MSARSRHLQAAERALERARRSMELAQARGADLSEGWRAMDDLSLNVQAESFASEDEDNAREESA